MIVTAKKMDEIDIRIIRHYTEGLTAKEIAYEMNLSSRQVEGRVRAMKEYYNCKSVTHLVSALIAGKEIEIDADL